MVITGNFFKVEETLRVLLNVKGGVSLYTFPNNRLRATYLLM